MNSGTRFQENFRKSIPLDNPSLVLYRFKDGTASWDKGSLTRFQQKNICDNMIFYTNNNKSKLFFIELKSTKGKSIPYGNFRDNQIKEMTDFSIKINTLCYFIVFFSDLERCFGLNIEDFNDFVANSERKSIPLSYFEEKGIEISVKKLRVNHRFDIISFLNTFY